MKNKGKYITAECRELAKNGDEKAVEAIIGHYIPYIKSFAHRTVTKYFGTGRSDIEEDVVQEMIAAIIKGSPHFREDMTEGGIANAYNGTTYRKREKI
ncbi:MAG: helix-turn-helix domain-containing protein [Candidatus Ornithomonoglobus sp.]